MNYSGEGIDLRRADLNFTTGAVTLLRGNFPDASSYGEFGAFLKHRLKVRDRLTIMTGGRYALTSTGGTDNTPLGPIDLEGQHGSFSGTLSSVLRVTHQLNVVSGFFAAS